MRIKKTILITLVTLMSVTVFVYAFVSNNTYVQQKEPDKKNLPGNPLDGRIVFEKNKCINCHSINGIGGKIGPDINSENFLTGDYELITVMWNHSPKMLKMIDQMNTNLQAMSSEDFRKLRYFISFLGYISKEGNINQGRELFVNMSCEKCHSVGKPVKGKIDLNKTGYDASPINLAQTMWNHAADMHKKQKALNIKISVFKGNEFANLAAYLESISGKKNRNLMYPGNPVLGEKIFNIKNCADCHLKENIGVPFNKINLHKSVNEIAGMMWNHSGLMESAMGEHKIAWPLFKGSEMGNLIAYLYYYNDEEVRGSVDEGRKMLGDKGCLGCHYNGNKYKTLSASDIKPFDNIDEFSSKLWSHIPVIGKEYYSTGKALPRLSVEDVKSMYLYFNRVNR